MPTLKEIREALQKQENRTSKATDGAPSASFPFWNMENDQTITIRFLPDQNDDNTFFWLERRTFQLFFPDDKVSVSFPCMEMWGDTCPMLNRAREEFKRDAEHAKTLKIWPSKTYLTQALIVDTPLKEYNPPECPIRILTLNPSIYNVVKTAVMDPEMENIPVDYQKGRDFKIRKTAKGQYADYSSSGFAMKERPLTKEEQGQIDKWGLFDLSTRLPKKPTQAEQDKYVKILNAYILGEEFDKGQWGHLL